MTLLAKKRLLETRAMPTQFEQRNTLMAELEELNETVKLEKRGYTQKENARFESLSASIKKLDKELKKMDSGDFENRGGYSSQEVEEIRAFINFVATGEHRDLSSSGSNVVIPKTISDMVISKVREIAPLFDRMTHFNVQGDLSLPSYPFDSHTTMFMNELGTAITASGGTFTTINLKAFPIGTLSLIGKSLLNRSNLDLISIIAEQMAMSIANFISNELINNTNARFSGTLATSVTQTVTGTAAGAVTLDDLISVQMSVASPFQNNSAWLLNPATFSAIRKLKDTTGQPLLVSGNDSIRSSLGYQLLGAPVMLDENVQTLGAGKRALYYGDFSQFVCNSQTGLQATVLLEKYSDIYAIGCIVTQELDFNYKANRSLSVFVSA